MKIIELTRGKIALIDDEDFDLVSSHKWCAVHTSAKRWYATRREKGKTIYMHVFLIGQKVGKEIDHCDGDGLNNQRCNLRFCTSGQNKANRRLFITPGKGSRFKGVLWIAKRNTWQAWIKKNYKRTYLGRYALEEDAARAYNRAALEYFGEFARLNDV